MRLDCRRWAYVGRHDAPRCTPQYVQAGVRGDLIQPGAELRTALEVGSVPPGAEEGLLHHVFGILERAKHPVTMDLELSPIEFRQLRKGSRIAASDRG